MKRPPAAPQQAHSWYQRIAAWWDSLHPAPPAPSSTVVGNKFAGPPNALILWIDNPRAAAGHNQQSYKTVLDALGYQVKTVSVAKFRQAPSSDDTLLVVPHARVYG